MDTIETIREKARQQLKTIVLSEGHDPRVRKAAEFIKENKIANTPITTSSSTRVNPLECISLSSDLANESIYRRNYCQHHTADKQPN